jgi:hypothetical protein
VSTSVVNCKSAASGALVLVVKEGPETIVMARAAMEQMIVATKQTASVRLISIAWILYPPAYDAHLVKLVTPFAENACTRETFDE